MSEWLSNNTTALDEVCNMLTTINWFIFNSITIFLASEVCNPLLEKLATFCAKNIENLFSESRKSHYWAPKLEKVSEGASPPPPRTLLAPFPFSRASNIILETPYSQLWLEVALFFGQDWAGGRLYTDLPFDADNFHQCVGIMASRIST